MCTQANTVTTLTTGSPIWDRASRGTSTRTPVPATSTATLPVVCASTEVASIGFTAVVPTSDVTSTVWLLFKSKVLKTEAKINSSASATALTVASAMASGDCAVVGVVMGRSVDSVVGSAFANVDVVVEVEELDDVRTMNSVVPGVAPEAAELDVDVAISAISAELDVQEVVATEAAELEETELVDVHVFMIKADVEGPVLGVKNSTSAL
eukprot:1181127-Amphidinium_carterae.1